MPVYIFAGTTYNKITYNKIINLNILDDDIVVFVGNMIDDSIDILFNNKLNNRFINYKFIRCSFIEKNFSFSDKYKFNYLTTKIYILGMNPSFILTKEGEKVDVNINVLDMIKKKYYK